MLDPAIIGLIGVGVGGLIGVGGTVGAAWVTTARTRTDKRRERARTAYADGLAAVATLNRCATVPDFTTCVQMVFDAQVQIRIFGSKQASEAYDDHAAAVQEYADAARAELGKRISLKSADRRAAEAFPTEAQQRFRQAHKAFVNAVRKDLGMRRWR